MYVDTVTWFCQFFYINSLNGMKAAGWTAHIIVYKTSLQTTWDISSE